MASSSANADFDLLSIVRALIAVSEHDLAFADRYLDRAATHLEGVCSRERFHTLEHERAALDRLTPTLREAADRQQWETLKALARQAGMLQLGLQNTEELVRVAANVHRSRNFRPTAAALALVGVVDLPHDTVEHARGAVTEHLRELGRHDAAWADFYRERDAWFQRLKAAADPTVDEQASRLDASAERKRIADAIERGAFAEIEQLADGLRRDPAMMQSHARVALSIESADLVLPFPAASASRAAALGLVAETLAFDDCGAGAAACRLRRHMGDGAAPGHVCSLELRPLCESLEFLAQHAVVSSAGRRYAPSFKPEAILVESFPESEPDVRTPLLDALGLPRRRGLTRHDIEDALSRNTAPICEELGLDPFEYAVVCIPFDAYARLAPRHEWGRAALWTHFDGYQVGDGFELRALVGGDVRYGGRHDLCMVGRHYDGAQVMARFAVVRRSRLWAA